MRILTVLIAAALGTGCYATTSTGYTPAYVGPSVAVTATTVGPDLVYVSPGVQVIADYDEPIFYTDGFYWREVGGVWYRSSYHNRGWVSWGAPRAVIGIRDRHVYRRYRPAGYTPRSNRGYNPRPAVRDNRWDRRDNRRDARWDRRDNRRDNRVERRDVRRDNRVERRDNRQERRDVRRDNRQERRDTRRDNRQERRDDRRDRRR